MQQGRVDVFEAAAENVHVGITRTTADSFEADLVEILVEPAVGTSLPFDDVSLPASVETNPTPSAIQEAATGVTPVCLGIATYGSVVIESSAAGEEPTSLFPERHVGVLAASDVVPDISAAVEHLANLAQNGQDAVVQTGPSATADMGPLVHGAHGPRAVHVVVIEDR